MDNSSIDRSILIMSVIIRNHKSMKSIFASKTIWFGVLQIVFGGVGLVTGWLDQQAGIALVMTGFASIGLRFNTSQPLG